MEKGQTLKEQIRNLEREIESLNISLSTLEAERASLSQKLANGQMLEADYIRSAEIGGQIRELTAEKLQKMSKVTDLKNEEIQRIARITAEEARKSKEAYSKPAPAPEKKDPKKEEKNNKSKGTSGATVFFAFTTIAALVALLITLGISRDKGNKTPSVDQMYEQEIAALKSRTSMSEKEIKEALEGVQRILYSGKLPEGEYLGTLTYDYYLGKSVELFGTLGNPKDCNGDYYSIDRADWAKDESLKIFIEKYDVVYNDIAKNLNEGDYEALEANIIKLADMQFDDFKMAGLNGGINPYGFKPQYRMAALLAATDRYSMVAEYALQNNVCFKPCLNLATGKKTKVNVFSMYEALMIDGGISSNGKIVLDSLGTSFPEDQSLYDIFLNEGYLYFQSREDNPITRILK